MGIWSQILDKVKMMNPRSGTRLRWWWIPDLGQEDWRSSRSGTCERWWGWLPDLDM